MVYFVERERGRGRGREKVRRRRKGERAGVRKGATVAQRPSIKLRLTIRACSLQTLELPGDTMTKRLLPFNKGTPWA